MSMKCYWKNLCHAIAFNVFQVYEGYHKTQVVRFVSTVCVVEMKRTYLGLYIF